MEQLLVSIIVPTFNNDKYIKKVYLVAFICILTFLILTMGESTISFIGPVHTMAFFSISGLLIYKQ